MATFTNEDHDENLNDANNQPPPRKTIQEIIKAQTLQRTESMHRYKLLGKAEMEKIIVDESNPRKVILKKLAFVVEGHDDIVIDLSGDISELKKKIFVIKEGVEFRLRTDFYVQRDIVEVLKYVRKTYLMGIPVDKTTHIVGTYLPNKNIQIDFSSKEELPSGVLARKIYSVSFLLTDNDNCVYSKFDFALKITKDWE